mmetsp:Transcript_47112/g.86419  ORF Transcript_47112/g.86419 Transcript_47112/m.86419 type:complete len:423 (+) Transcript_47112:69-1337(+)
MSGLSPPPAAVQLTRATTETSRAPPPPTEYVRARSEASALVQRQRVALAAGRQPFSDRLLERLTSTDHRGLQERVRGIDPTAEEQQQTVVKAGSPERAVDLFDTETPSESRPSSEALPAKDDEVKADSKPWACCICLERDVAPEQENPCGDPACKGASCRACLRDYIEMQVESCRFAVFPVRCPVVECRKRIPCRSWMPLVDDDVIEKYQKGASDLLSIRCPVCDETNSLFQVGYDEDDRSNRMEAFIERIRILEGSNPGEAGKMERALKAAWKEFQLESGSVDAVLDAILAAVQEEASHFVNPDNGGSLVAVLQLITDVERRCTLHLAALRKHPKIYTPCCSEPVCFKCKISGHHIGLDCAEVQRRALEVECQFCPECGVATQKTEGCDEMICLCGAVWQWEGEDMGMLFDDREDDSDRSD